MTLNKQNWTIMKPDETLVTIDENLSRIKNLLQELVLLPRIKALEWSKLTKQTPNMKIGYPGQHLASLITGIEGSRTGARGDDLKDGTEVKSCSRVDQLDTCNQCKNKVLRIELLCPHCGSNKIKRMDDSKWLFSIKSETELELLTKKINRIFLTIADYPNFEIGDFSSIRFQAFEIWNNDPRHFHFSTLMSNYYNKIFLEHIKLNPKATPAPKNFWPYSFQFYLCNPIKVFSCIVNEANTKPTITIEKYIEPKEDRTKIISELMPIDLLVGEELIEWISNVPIDVLTKQITNQENPISIKEIKENTKANIKKITSAIPFLDQDARGYLKLRDTDVISKSKSEYSRRD